MSKRNEAETTKVDNYEIFELQIDMVLYNNIKSRL